MVGTETETKDGDERRTGRWPTLRRLLRRVGSADPARLTTPTGEKIIDIYRRAYVNGGLDIASAREVHALWHRESLRTLPSLLLILLPAGLLIALHLSGLVTIPVFLWTALVCATVANVLFVALWQMRVAPWLHARGVPVWKRSLTGFAVVSVAVATVYQGLHLVLPQHSSSLVDFLPVLLPFQILLFWTLFISYDLHIDYALVTRRWTDTPLQRLLPYDKRGKLVFLRASDHYVIVRTTKGEHELRMRFADALERLGNARGLQVHRSFWVAQDFLSTPRKDGRRMVMRVDGVAIPISATYRDAVVRHLDLTSQS